MDDLVGVILRSRRGVRRSVASAVQGLSLLAALLIAAGCGGSSLNVQSRTATFTAADRPSLRNALAPVGNALAPAGAVDAGFAGPRTLRGRVTLRARVRSSTRIVAVTFILAGRPLGTATRPPWVLDLDSALLPTGTARLRVAAVNRLGARALSRPVTVRVLGGGEQIHRVSSQRQLDEELPALARGGITVQLAPGTYREDAIVLGPGTRLSGSGAATVLTPPSGSDAAAMVSTSADHVRISDLGIDGGGRLDDAVSIANGAGDVRVQRIEVSGVRDSGVVAWGPHSDVSVQDSTFVGARAAAGAGVFDLGSNESSDDSVIRTRVSGFRGYGILFAQRFYGLKGAALHNLALDNNVSDIVDPNRHDGTDAGGIWTGGVEAAVIGNTVSRTGTDGIETVGSSTADTIIANEVSNTPVAIYIELSTNDSLVAANRISGVSTGINVEWRHAGGGSNANTFAGNRIAAAEVGVFVDVQEDDTSITANTFTAAGAMPIVLQGSSGNVVRGNRGCGAGPGPIVVQRTALTETGAIAQSSHNHLASNERTGPCTAS